jgi:Domain of unknown function (DUF5753)
VAGLRQGVGRSTSRGLTLEEHASQIRVYGLGVIPELLQTYDYAYNAALADPSQPAGTEDDAAWATHLRQEIILRRQDMSLHLVVGEAALHQRIRDAGAMREQRAVSG